MSHACPICKVALRKIERYPNYVCASCVLIAQSQDGEPLSFFNTSFSGGLIATYTKSGEHYDSNRCWINGVECVADEARFGGIVIQPL
jgi:hypothetical protein